MRVILVALLISLAVPAVADPTPPTTDVSKMVSDDCARARQAGKTCVIDVPPEEVDGKTPSVGDVGVTTLKFWTHESLIRVRRDFILEILKSAEDL